MVVFPSQKFHIVIFRLGKGRFCNFHRRRKLLESTFLFDKFYETIQKMYYFCLACFLKKCWERAAL